MIYFNDMYAREIVGQSIVDKTEEKIGVIKDIVIEVGQQFPKVVGFLIKSHPSKREKFVLISEVNFISRKTITLKSKKADIAYGHLREGDMFLQRDLMDKQIVDIHGSKVVRVNDLKLSRVGDDILLVAADVGIKGILRHLNLENFAENVMAIFNKTLKDELIGWNYVEPLQTDIARLKLVVPFQGVAQLHPADIASIISQVHTDEKTAIFGILTTEKAAEALHELEPHIQAFLVSTLETKKALAIIEKMPSDEVADVLGDLPEEKANELLRLMKTKKAHEVQELLKHGEETAGGLMTTEFITIPQSYTARQTIEKLRDITPSAETIYYLYVTDDDNVLVGVLTLRNLIVSKEDAIVNDIMVQRLISVNPEMNQRQVAEVISKYNLLAVPVLDKTNHILGIITVDDVVDFIIPPLARKKRMSVG